LCPAQLDSIIASPDNILQLVAFIQGNWPDINHISASQYVLLEVSSMTSKILQQKLPIAKLFLLTGH